MVRLFLPSVGIEEFSSTVRALCACFCGLSGRAELVPVFIHIDPRQLAEKGAHPVSLPHLAKEVEKLAQSHPKVSFTTRLEGRGLAQTWQVSIFATRIPVLTARRVSILPASRNYEGEVAWTKESIRNGIFHSGTTTRPDYSEFAEWALPQHFYLFQKIVEVSRLRRMAELELATGAASPLWPFPSDLVDAIAHRFGTEPILVPNSDKEKRKLVKQMDACFADPAAEATLDRFLSDLGVTQDAWAG